MQAPDILIAPNTISLWGPVIDGRDPCADNETVPTSSTCHSDGPKGIKGARSGRVAKLGKRLSWSVIGSSRDTPLNHHAAPTWTATVSTRSPCLSSLFRTYRTWILRHAAPHGELSDRPKRRRKTEIDSYLGKMKQQRKRATWKSVARTKTRSTSSVDCTNGKCYWKMI